MDEKKSILSLFGRNVATTFTPAILAMTFAGLVVRRDAEIQEGMFALYGGLAFENIIQIFIWACVISLPITVLASDIWFKKMMLLWRVVVVTILVMAATVTFAIVFRWIPLDSWEAWFGFISVFTVSFGIGLAAMIAKAKFEGRRYNKLLSNYKSKMTGDENK